jgi:hypothetical protein
MATKKHTYTFANGRSEALSYKQEWGGLADRGFAAWMRVGHFSIAINPTGNDVGVSKCYAAHSLDDPKCSPPKRRDRAWFAESKRSALARCKEVAKALKLCAHPLRSEVMADIRRYRDFYR